MGVVNCKHMLTCDMHNVGKAFFEAHPHLVNQIGKKDLEMLRKDEGNPVEIWDKVCPRITIYFKELPNVPHKLFLAEDYIELWAGTEEYIESYFHPNNVIPHA